MRGMIEYIIVLKIHYQVTKVLMNPAKRQAGEERKSAFHFLSEIIHELKWIKTNNLTALMKRTLRESLGSSTIEHGLR